MKIHQLQALVTVADAGSIRASARLLGVSQAAVTKALRELEKEQQLTLLSRSPSGVSFTDAGQTLLSHARLMIGQLERATEDLAKLRGDQTGKLAIAVTPLVMLTFMAETITLFRQRMPKVRLEIFEGLTAVALPRLREGLLDLSVVPLSSTVTSREFDHELLFTYQSCVIARRGHPLAQRRSIHDLLEQDWAVNYTAASYEGMMRNIFWQHGASIEPHRLHCAHSSTLLTELVRHNDMLTHCPRALLLTDSMRDWAQPLDLAEQFDLSRVAVIGLHNTMRSDASQCFVECLSAVIRKRSRSAKAHNRLLFDLLDILL
ncbi:LysR family transcriptional regulator [Paraburkholderia sp.]|uniref:LysR family transcriptional regulator n=1 Tax=Paraburkholderia sp. TaxID=1926495 RepID=UPI0039E40861